MENSISINPRRDVKLTWSEDLKTCDIWKYLHRRLSILGANFNKLKGFRIYLCQADKV